MCERAEGQKIASPPPVHLVTEGQHITNLRGS
jgi:hypothetical protein